MADLNPPGAPAPGAAPALPLPPAARTWPDVVNLGVHYVAGGVLLLGLGYLVSVGKVDAQVLVALVFGAAGAIGINPAPKSA